MTKREIMDLIQHRRDTNTFYVQCAGYGFHGTDENKIAEQLNNIICQMPGCGNQRFEQYGRSSYLCRLHYDEACKEEALHAPRKSTGLLLAESCWSAVLSPDGVEDDIEDDITP